MDERSTQGGVRTHASEAAATGTRREPVPRSQGFDAELRFEPVEPRRIARATKRALEVLLSSAALLLLSPLLALTAIIIKLDSPGPVFFRQRRIGRGGEEFEMLKFRTMVDGADDHKHRLLHLNDAADGLFKISSDPRITRFGSILRSTSMDELPQLAQVLTGHMSLVGPRPLVAEEDAQIRGEDRRRTTVRPGITGPWQVAGASRIPIVEMAKLDSDYVLNWTIWGDIKLILGTIPHVIGRRGV